MSNQLILTNMHHHLYTIVAGTWLEDKKQIREGELDPIPVLPSLPLWAVGFGSKSGPRIQFHNGTRSNTRISSVLHCTMP